MWIGIIAKRAIVYKYGAVSRCVKESKEHLLIDNILLMGDLSVLYVEFIASEC